MDKDNVVGEDCMWEMSMGRVKESNGGKMGTTVINNNEKKEKMIG